MAWQLLPEAYHQLEDEAVECDLQGKECHNLLEYQTLIKPFMED